MTRSLRRILAFAIGSFTVMAAGPLMTAVQASEGNNGERNLGGLAGINHLVVIYDENHSFDNLYGFFKGANGISQASDQSKTQIDLATGMPYTCLPQTDSHLVGTCIPNGPFDITKYVPANQKTRDLVHRYYQEQVQIDGGKMDKFVTVSDAKGLSIGYYPTEQLPVATEAANYVLQDNFFHAAFGGSFLNHQWLVCACTPVYKDAVKDGKPGDLHTVLGANGLPTKDGQLTTQATGDYAVNTIFPAQAPTIKGAPQLPLLTNANIGDRMTAAGVSWNWYSGGWNDAVAGKADPLFQYHHQAFNYYANYAVGTPGREHLKDETDFIAAAKAGTLPAVSFVKPIGTDNEHPGYTDLLTGEQHLEALINDVRSGPNWKDTAIVITYDEHGGFWDHVAPPTSEKHSDIWGPGSRVPTIIISPLARRHFVDHTLYDTTSILTTIEHRWNLEPLGTRDANANDLRRAFKTREGSTRNA
ncbi:MAG TPA: alkaline phosphatase family protein [Candidatus Dormibacteraeota bacterium]|nr:alkaline phosphatase family protein [Candidatus Dormibacteraeota bacterium]